MKNTVILCTKFGMGTTDLPELGTRLIQKYFSLLLEATEPPAVICFYTDGVKLVAGGSPVLAELRQLESKGVRLIVCSTCVDAMKLTDQVQAGIIGGMPDILEAQIKADKVITI